MVWLFLIVVLILFVAFEGFRVFVLVAGLILGGTIYYFHNESEKEKKLSLTRIKQHEVVLSEVKMMSSEYDKRIVGRIKNLSNQYGLNRLTLFLTYRDCFVKNGARSCDVVGQESKVLYVSIPPTQVRTFDKYLYSTSNIRPKGKLEWDYEIKEIIGKPYR
jgi:hypothetical protein